jgi:Tfp pilus assembly protein PilF
LRAIALDSAASEPHVVLAWVQFWYDWKFDAAGREFEHAIALNPSNAVAYQWYGLLLFARGQGDSAVAMMRRAESLDPLSGGMKADLARVLSNLGQSAQALAKYREALEATPENGRFSAMWGDALLAQGRPAEAMEVYRQAPDFGVRRWAEAGARARRRQSLGHARSRRTRRLIILRPGSTTPLTDHTIRDSAAPSLRRIPPARARRRAALVFR